MSAGALPVAGRKRIEVAKALATQPELLLLESLSITEHPIDESSLLASQS